MKVATIGCKRKAEDEDPRPVHFRMWAGYTDHVNSLVTNYCWASSKDIAYRYLMPKADLRAAVLDHDYASIPFTEYWVDEANKVGNVRPTLKICIFQSLPFDIVVIYTTYVILEYISSYFTADICTPLVNTKYCLCHIPFTFISVWTDVCITTCS